MAEQTIILKWWSVCEFSQPRSKVAKTPTKWPTFEQLPQTPT